MQLCLFEKEVKTVEVTDNIEMVEFNPFLAEKRIFNDAVRQYYMQNPYAIGIILQEDELFERLCSISKEMEREIKVLRVNKETLKAFMDLQIKRVLSKGVEKEKMYFVEWNGQIKIVAYLYEKQKGQYRIKDIANDFDYLFVVNYLYHYQEFFQSKVKDFLEFVKSVPKAREPLNVLKKINLKWYPPYSLDGVYLSSDLSMSVDTIRRFYHEEDTGILRDLDFVEEEIEYLQIQRDDWRLKKNEEKAKEIEREIQKLLRHKENLLSIKKTLRR